MALAGRGELPMEKDTGGCGGRGKRYRSNTSKIRNVDFRWTSS